MNQSLSYLLFFKKKSKPNLKEPGVVLLTSKTSIRNFQLYAINRQATCLICVCFACRKILCICNNYVFFSNE